MIESGRRTARWIAVVVLVLAAVYFGVTLWRRCAKDFAWDFAINWTAANGLKSGVSLYDPARLRRLGQSLVGPALSSFAFTEPLTSYTNPPSTALLFLPFTVWPFSQGLTIYRLALMAAFVAAVGIASLALPAPDRPRGWWWGGLALLTLSSVAASIQLGQVDAWIMLALAASLWAASRGRWGVAGIGLGWASVLKISPAILVVYCLLRGKWQTALAAALTGAALLGLAALLGQPGDLLVFGFKILPALSAGSLFVENQSLTAWLARLFLPESNFLIFSNGLGLFRLAGPVLALGFIAGVWSLTRRQRLPSFELSLLILAALLVGPIAWDHYVAWAILPLVLMADHRLWTAWSPRQQWELLALLILGGIFLDLPILYFPPASVAAHWALRLGTGVKTMGVLVWLGVGLGLLAVRTGPGRASVGVNIA